LAKTVCSLGQTTQVKYHCWAS